MKNKDLHENAKETSGCHCEPPCCKCRRECCSGGCRRGKGFVLDLERRKLFQMLSDSMRRQRRLERCIVAIAHYVQGDDSARNLRLDDRVLSMTQSVMVNEAIKRLRMDHAKPKVVFSEILDEYSTIPGAYESLDAFRRQVYRKLKRM